MPDSFSLLAIALAILELSGITAALHAIFNARSAQGSTAWAIALVAAPIVALPAYLVFGRNRFMGYVDARRDADRAHRWISEQAREVTDEYRSRLEDVGGALLSLERLANLPFTRGNRLQLLVDGAATFAAINAAIDRAEHYVLVQFFIVRDDELGRELQSHLLAAAARGAAVYFLIDDVGSRTLSSHYVSALRDGGVRVEMFRSSRDFMRLLQVNFRNHRKVVVVDGDYAFVGGLNVGDEYMGRDARFGAWRDTFVGVEGPAADALQLVFAEDWHWATREPLKELQWERRIAPGSDAEVLVVPSGPADPLETGSLMFVHAIHAARERFWIASPYFVPNAEVIAALQLAALRGVDVRILLPANPDHFVVYLASFFYMKLAGVSGVRFYRYSEGFLHQKVFLVDDFAAGIGTANLDNRSFRLNFEVTLLGINRDFAREVEAMFERDFSCSDPVRSDEIDHHRLPFRLAAALARLFSPVL